jgi:acetate kinase
VRILAINCGSSSIKCALVAGDPPRRAFELRAENIGTPEAQLLIGGTRRALPGSAGFEAALVAVFAALREHWAEFGELDAVVHRIVHGGEQSTTPVVIDDESLAKLDALERLAPLHNPPALQALRRARELFARVPHVAVFDTAFHATLPRRAREYALPDDIRTRFGIRRYGFHGISHAEVAAQVATALQKMPQELRVISCHLGSGASLAAIEYGRSVETSMGMTPLEGLVMGTRAGDLDPGVLLELMHALPPEALDKLLNERAGLKGLCGTADMREIEQRAAAGDEQCRLAIGLYTHRIRKYLGAYAAVMGGVDAVAFTGGIGEHSALVRHRCLQRLEFLGAVIDEERNREARVSAQQPVTDIAVPHSRARIFVVRADEETAMAREAAKLLASRKATAPAIRIPIAVSARHAHLSQATVEKLFGPGYQLQPKTALSQTGQFSARESVRLIGPRGSIEHVRLMGPPRAHDQVEISRSDEFVLGVDAPVRISGDLANTPGITIEGPRGRATISSGVICARRHIHMAPADAQRLGVRDCDAVLVRIDSRGRDLTFSDVTVRTSPGFTLELHLDTDEANAAGVTTGDQAELIVPRGHAASPAT